MILLLLAACARDTAADTDSGAPTGDTAPPPPSLELGTGETAFLPLADGDDVTVVFGPQGSWHIVGAARLCRIEPPATLTYRIVHEASGAEIANTPYTLYGLLPDADPACGIGPDLWGYLDTTPLGTPDAGEALDGEVVVLSLALGELADARRVVARRP